MRVDCGQLEHSHLPWSVSGYARVSTVDQDFAIQRAALKATGCEVICAEKASGARRDGLSFCVPVKPSSVWEAAGRSH
jgi:hypothetical protein